MIAREGFYKYLPVSIQEGKPLHYIHVHPAVSGLVSDSSALQLGEYGATTAPGCCAAVLHLLQHSLAAWLASSTNGVVE